MKKTKAILIGYSYPMAVRIEQRLTETFPDFKFEIVPFRNATATKSIVCHTELSPEMLHYVQDQAHEFWLDLLMKHP